MSSKAKLIGLLDYVEELTRLPERAVMSVRSYRTLHLYEHQLRSKFGIRHDLIDEDGAIWLRIERLQRREPPTPDEDIRPWLIVSRDPTKHPEVHESIIRSMSKDDAEELLRANSIDVEDIMASPRGDATIVDVRLRLDRFPQLATTIQEYCDDIWIQWAIKEIPRRETIAIYDKFFGVLQTIEAAGVDNPLEMVLGVGFALWEIQGKTVEHPIVEAMVEASIDPQTHAIHIRPRETEIQVCLKPFMELDNPAVPSLRKNAVSFFEQLVGEDVETDTGSFKDFSPFDPSVFEPVLRDAVTLLSPEAVYWPDTAKDPNDRTLPDTTDILTLTDNWAIYVRPRSGNLFAQDIQRLKDTIEEAEEDELPTPGRRLVTPPEDVIETHAGPDLTGGLGIDWGWSSDESDEDRTPDNSDVLFPKPFNDAQVEIVRRLEKEDGVVVQGPPGTGKTHTIANIICHYLATGRSVLVASKGEPALEVLRDQIPEEVRNLTISLLTNERQGLKQLEAAVTFMANKVVNQDVKRLDQRRMEKEREVITLRKELGFLESRITDLAKKQLENVPETLCLDSKQWPADLARLISEQKEKYKWLTDEIGAADQYEPCFTQQHLDDLRSARRRLGADLVYLNVGVPNRNDLPDAQTLGKIHENLLQADSLAAKAAQKQLPPMTIRDEETAERAQGLRSDLLEIRTFLEEAEEHDWLRELYAIWVESGFYAEGTKLIRDLVSEIDYVAEERKLFAQRPVFLPDSVFTQGQAEVAVRRAVKGQRPFPLVSFGNQEAKKLLGQIEICGKIPENVDEWKHVGDYFTYRDQLLSLIARWNAISEEYGLPLAVRESNEAERWLIRIQKLLGRAIQTASCYRERAASEVTILFSHDVDRAGLPFDASEIERLLETIDINVSRIKLTFARGSVDAACDYLHNCSGKISDELRSFLQNSVGNASQDAISIANCWRELLAELRRINDLRTDLDIVQDVSMLIENSGGPLWADVLRTCPAEDSDAHIPLDALNAWRFRRVQSYLKNIDAREELSELAKRQSECARLLDRAMTEVVRLRTHIGLHNRMQRGGRLSALTRFLHAIRNIGKGTGVRARRYRGDARKAMLECMEAVPCWIMPTWRVSESLPATLGAFDLIVVDEASQSDVLALPALLRAKKILVVGDDRQVSPSSIGLEERKLLQLRSSYLQEQPFADMLMPGTSLYDLAQAVFPGGRILLNEHFRCVEPIIRFSLQFYPEEIVPLRIPKPSERLDPPLIDVFVTNGARDGNKVNRAEATAVVNEIERLVNDPTYENRSIGVISLIGNKQASLIQNLLVERIGEDAFLRHHIACGDSATFQGKERDIMFLSMVASPSKAQAQVSRLFEQRFNVALSRAKDRMYLFRSVKVEDLPNPQDLKLRVINHFRTPMPVSYENHKELESLCESDFERDVFKRLLEMEYRVTPQVSVGEYRIDLVVDGRNDRRLAVELDGDRYHGPDRWFDDYRRQKILERAGWRFWRCWASSFFLDPEGCIAELVNVLQGMKIEPIGQIQTRHAFTEHRIIEIKDSNSETAGNENIEAEEKVEVGDKVIIAFNEEPKRHYQLTLSEGDEDLANGIVSMKSATGSLLLGASVEDEIDLLWKSETRNAMILDIQKANLAESVEFPHKGTVFSDKTETSSKIPSKGKGRRETMDDSERRPPLKKKKSRTLPPQVRI